MNCATHPDKASVGYCKKCGKFGCEECLTKVIVTGTPGKQTRPTEALLCHDCLAKIRPDTPAPQAAKSRKSSGALVARNRKSGKRLARPLVVAFVAFVVAFALFMVITFIVGISPSRQLMSADEVVTEALNALATGDTDDFLSCVDVETFIFRMDSTGLTQRDYEQAHGKQKTELEASHSALLARDLLIAANLQKQFVVSAQDIKESSASFTIKPWIQFGSRLYKQILLEKRKGQWRISGLASPDF
ncbi:B-box zinc finger protein [Candidatus Poribacteria bacterium]|nr:B-box zinc finger protein [Candidatus Poribacteria bacterium]